MKTRDATEQARDPNRHNIKSIRRFAITVALAGILAYCGGCAAFMEGFFEGVGEGIGESLVDNDSGYDGGGGGLTGERHGGGDSGPVNHDAPARSH